MTKKKKKKQKKLKKAETTEVQTAANCCKYAEGWGGMYGPPQEEFEDKEKLIPKDYRNW